MFIKYHGIKNHIVCKIVASENGKYICRIQGWTSMNDRIDLTNTLLDASDKISFFTDNKTIMKELNDNCFLTKQFIQSTVDKAYITRYFYLLFMQYLYQFVNDDSKISFTNGSIDITVEDIEMKFF